MTKSTIENQLIINKAVKMKESGMYVSEISKTISKETGIKTTQMALWRLFDSLKEEPQKKLLESDYPSLEDYAYLFNTKVQKDKNSTTTKFDNITIRRDLMLRILNRYYKTEFTCSEVKRECNDRDGDSNFLAHWDYLLKLNYIEKVGEYKFKFCDRVKKWKTFGKI